LAYNDSRKLSLLSKTELEWLLGKKHLSDSYNRKIKSQTRKKIENFENFELPLLLEKGLLSFQLLLNLVTVLQKWVTHKIIFLWKMT